MYIFVCYLYKSPQKINKNLTTMITYGQGEEDEGKGGNAASQRMLFNIILLFELCKD